MNIPNTLTIFRFLLVPVFLAFLLNGYIMQALVTFIMASVTDALDGAIARMTDSMTEIGMIMDPLADKALVISALIALSAMGRLPVWITLVVIVRDIIVVSGGIIIYKRRYKMKMKPLVLGKVTTFLMLTLLVSILLGIYWNREFSFIPPLAWLTTALVLISGVQYSIRGIKISKSGRETVSVEKPTYEV